MVNRDILLIVDDVKMNRAILNGMFASQYKPLEAENGEQAVKLIEQYKDSIAVVLLDLSMPVMDGYQVMDEMNRRSLISEIPVIIITADNSADSEMKAFDAGASDVVQKPFEAHIVRRRVQNVVELYQRKQLQEALIEEQAAKLRKSNAGIIASLASIVETRSLETGLHIKRISMYVNVLLNNVASSYPEYLLNEHRIDIITDASSLHDIGKIAIPDSVLNKPGRLTDEERAIMQTHTVRGCEILDSLTDITDREYLQYAYNICRYHHERWDGSGYPDELRGDAIPICAQVVGVADCYDALTSDRVYKKSISPQLAISMILNGECGKFSPKLMECLKAVEDSFIELASDYADSNGRPQASNKLLQSAAPIIDESYRDVQRSDSLKYFAILNYVKATVMEADFSTGIYQLVYQFSSDFDLLRSGSSFADSIRRFAEGAVHPDDRAGMLELLGGYSEAFFGEGLLQTQRYYRIYNRASGDYLRWQASIVRINPDAPQQRKVLLIWKQDEETAADGGRRLLAENMLLQNTIVDVQQVRNDKWFTMPNVSRGLLALLGYTEDEICRLFHNRYIGLIHPDDREGVIVKTAQQQRSGTFQEMEYRLVSKNGDPIWVLDKSQLIIDDNGRESFYCALIDITSSKRTEDELHTLTERYQIIMEQTNDVIFEWRADTDQLVFSPSWGKRFGYATNESGVMLGRLYRRYIRDKDIDQFEKLLSGLREGERYSETEVRLIDSAGNYRWCRFRITVMRGHDGSVSRAIGLITDVDNERRTIQQLRNMAERDSLTRLYNKNVARQKINACISSMRGDDFAAMFVIDVDDFKRINDHYGHMLGDTVLQKVAGELESVFRPEDIVARIGGDEFLVFMTAIHDSRIIEERATRINTILKNVIIQTIPDHTISCSIGLVLCPEGGSDFDELFIHGDLALYDAKRKGKNQHSFYMPSMNNAEFEVAAESIIGENEAETTGV